MCYFPVICDGRIEYLLRVYPCGSTFSAVISSFLADELESLSSYTSVNCPMYLNLVGNKIIATVGEKSVTLFEYPENMSVSQNAFSRISATSNSVVNAKMTSDVVVSVRQTSNVLIAEINAGRPCVVAMESRSGEHTVVLRGYTSLGTWSIWNPWYEYYESYSMSGAYVPTGYTASEWSYTPYMHAYNFG